MITGIWLEKLKREFNKPYYKELYHFIHKEYATKTVYPPKDELFAALRLTDLRNVKAVILGQDPYHEYNQATGLCFSVPKSQKNLPPSLQNIYKEIEEDIGCKMPKHGDLSFWASQGVLLLNTVLTVEAHKANSHKDKGWELLTDEIIRIVGEEDRAIVFLLWGKSAESKKVLLKNPKHLILTAPHPSPLSAYRGFFGCKHFSITNHFLKKNNVETIKWEIPE